MAEKEKMKMVGAEKESLSSETIGLSAERHSAAPLVNRDEKWQKLFIDNGRTAAGFLKALTESNKDAYLICKAFAEFVEKNYSDRKRGGKLKMAAAEVAAEMAGCIWPGREIYLPSMKEMLDAKLDTEEDRLRAAGEIFMGFARMVYDRASVAYLTVKTIEYALEHAEKIRVGKRDLAAARRLAKDIWPGVHLKGMTLIPENAKTGETLPFRLEYGDVSHEEENIMFL